MAEDTVIGSSIIIDGELHGEEDLVLEGKVKGKVILNANLFVASSGNVEADIEAQRVDNSGSITGNVNASDKAELQSGCRMTGNIRSPRILIADGALFRGNVDMDM